MKSLVLLFIFILCISCEKVTSDNLNPKILDESYISNSYTNIDKDSLVIFQWNIGHFSHGNLPYSDINININSYKSILAPYSPDIISLNEYSAIIGVYDNNKYFTRDILFNDYTYAYIGIQNNYSCNSVFSTFPLMQMQYNIFLCNKNAKITHTSLITADEYYYMSSFFQWKGNKIIFISTHLAFDNNNSQIAKAQIQELLDKFKEYKYVIMCGDWNCSQESYDIFKDNDYQLANCDIYGNMITCPALSECLDNIVVKGINILNVKVIKTDLSDHYPIMCTIKIK